MINLRLILVSGKTKEFLFSPNDSASDIAKHVYDNWPMDWEEEQVSSPNILRLIYQGRFLHGNVTLGALKLPFGKTTVMHLVARETLPEPNSQGQRNREKTGESNCCVILWRHLSAQCGVAVVFVFHAAGTEETQPCFRNPSEETACELTELNYTWTLSSFLMKVERTKDIFHYDFSVSSIFVDVQQC